jgi:hypothetical protein
VPALADAAALEQDVVMPGAGQVVAQSEPCLAGAHDQGVNRC